MSRELQQRVSDNRYGYNPMHFWRVMVYHKHWCEAIVQIKWVLYCIAMYWSSGYYPAFFPCNFCGTPVFWNPPRHMVACHSCTWILDVTISCVLPCHTFVCWTLVCLAYSVSRMRARMWACATRYFVNTAPLWFRANIKHSICLNQLQLSLYKHSR